MNRRDFLTTAGGATGALVVGSSTAVAQEEGGNQSGGNQSGGNQSGGNQSGGGGGGGGGMTTYKLGGKVAGWQGQAPDSIKGKKNPPLVFKPGQKYKVVWENLDGMPHDFTIQDSNGKAIEQTKEITEKGQTLSLTFTASEKMAQYICTIHPTTMKGEVQQSASKNNAGPVKPEEMGVPLQPHYVGMAAVLMMMSTFAFTFYLLKYGESSHTKGGNQ